MRRGFVAVLVGLLVLGGCARGPAAPAAGPAVSAAEGRPSAAREPAGVEETEVYTAVLRQYLGSRSDNSFSVNGFATTYVVARAIGGEPLADDTRRRIAAALAAVTDVRFVATRDEVIQVRDGCPQAPAGSIVITLGAIAGDDREVQVPVNGFVACLGATWLTYVVHNGDDAGWTVTGTTGERSIA
ncbi:hypothetical protein GCM10018962_62690 [Dactylosporangium matsuzakiense]|uniref:Mce-associated membrane protein n=2 Tax=Dactylosporangium matsuzakiense TaxID=53360 RepID=A0A9W6KG27_9ACTN|nr:hypothetical protein GCM10017581_026040 [Dactylosporangium matsuzakiense]